MASFLEYASQFEVKKNPAVESFVAALAKQQSALDKDELTRRSWIKQEGEWFTVRLGKLDGTYRMSSKGDVHDFLNRAAAAAREDEEFIKLIDAAYSEDSVGDDAPKPKRAYKRRTQAAEVHTDVVRFDLKNRPA